MCSKVLDKITWGLTDISCVCVCALPNQLCAQLIFANANFISCFVVVVGAFFSYRFKEDGAGVEVISSKWIKNKTTYAMRVLLINIYCITLGLFMCLAA